MSDPQPVPRQQGAPDVDYLVDERGSRIEVPADTTLRTTTDVEQAVGATGPTNWWRLGLIALGVVIAILLVLQLMSGGANTAVVPETPTIAPQTTPATGSQ